jgi:hypothetical protein
MVTLARDEAVARGITINGLPIMLKRPTGFGDMENLDQYYRECVIGGPGAFLVPVRERSQFAEAIRTKIIREIAILDDLSAERTQFADEGAFSSLTRGYSARSEWPLTARPLIQRIQADAPMDCSTRGGWPGFNP